jgi:hypothetical protein
MLPASPRTFDEALALTAEARQKAREMLPALLAGIFGGWVEYEYHIMHT